MGSTPSKTKATKVSKPSSRSATKSTTIFQFEVLNQSTGTWLKAAVKSYETKWNGENVTRWRIVTEDGYLPQDVTTFTTERQCINAVKRGIKNCPTRWRRELEDGTYEGGHTYHILEFDDWSALDSKRGPNKSRSPRKPRANRTRRKKVKRTT